MMKRKYLGKISLTSLFFLALLTVECSCEPQVSPVLVPQPQSVEWSGGVCYLSSNVKVQVPRKDVFLGEVALHDLRLAIKNLSSTGKSMKPMATIKIETTGYRRGRKWQRPEGYKLVISKEGIRIFCADSAGLHYGIQTLLQLMGQSPGGKVPCGRVEDWPDFSVRAMHICLFRYAERTPNIAYLKALLSRVADRAKLNTAIIQVDWMMRYTSHPEMSRPNALTPEQIAELIACAKRHHVRLIPHLQCLSHQWSLFGYGRPDLVKKDNSEVYQHDSPEVKTITTDLIEELLKVFQSKFIHVGLDEAGSLSDRGDDGHIFEQQIIWLRNTAQNFGARILIWPDMLRRYDPSNKLLSEIPRDVVMCEWQYGDQEAFPTLEPFCKNGFQVWATGSSKYHLSNLGKLAWAARKMGACGLVASTWNSMGSLGHPQEAKSMSGLLLAGEYGWHVRKPPLKQLRYDPIDAIRRLCPEGK